MVAAGVVPVPAYRTGRRRLRRDAAVAPASDAAVGARLAAARVRSLNLGMPRRRDAHAVVASRIWAASVDAEAAEVARARREALEASVREEKKPAAPKIDWKALEAAASARGDLLAGCAICLGPFSGFEDGSTMLLDCAHAFHASCLAALERHLGVENRRCALCRRPNYNKHVTKRAARDRRAAAATVLTGAARARLAVKRTDTARRAFYGAGRGEARARLAFLARTVRAHNDELVGASDDALDALFAESDDAVAAARAVLAAAVAPPRRDAEPERPSDAVWAAAEARALKRRAEEEAVCAVCLGPLQASTLLPCSHEFHAACVDAMERFRPGDSGAAACPTCPVCREPYRERRSSSSGAVAKVDVS